MNQSNIKYHIIALLEAEGVKFASVGHRDRLVARIVALFVQECAGVIAGRERVGDGDV